LRLGETSGAPVAEFNVGTLAGATSFRHLRNETS
jgi:hypothetical protein